MFLTRGEFHVSEDGTSIPRLDTFQLKSTVNLRCRCCHSSFHKKSKSNSKLHHIAHRVANLQTLSLFTSPFTEGDIMNESNNVPKHRSQTMALLCLVATFLAASPVQAGAGSHSLVFPRSYNYHRRPMDLMSDMISIPMYNSLFRQQEQLARLKQALRDEGPTYHVQELSSGEIELTMDVPGVAAKDLTVELLEDGTILRVSGSRRHHHGSVTEFAQLFRIDKDVDTESLVVKLSSGVLRISASKKEKVIKKLQIVEDEPKQDIIKAEVLPGQEEPNATVEGQTEEVNGMTITTEDEQ
jgi:HSP20 family molecular chaperone IbpA